MTHNALPLLAGFVERAVVVRDDGWWLEVEGWLLCAAEPIEILRGRAPRRESVELDVKSRPDVARQYPEVPHALGCGFSGRLPLQRPPKEPVSIQFDVVLESGRQFTIAMPAPFDPASTAEKDTGPLQILFVTRRWGPQGPNWNIERSRVKLLVDAGHRVTVLDFDPAEPSSKEAALDGVELVTLDGSVRAAPVVDACAADRDLIWAQVPGAVRLLTALPRSVAAPIVFAPVFSILRTNDDTFGDVIELRNEPGAVFTFDSFCEFCRASSFVVFDKGSDIAGIEWRVANTLGIEVGTPGPATGAEEAIRAVFGATAIMLRNPAAARAESRMSIETGSWEEHGWTYALSAQSGKPVVSREAVDIVIPIHNAVDDVALCLRSIWRHSDLPFRVVLVDDGSTDERLERTISEATALPNALCLEKVILRNAKAVGFTRAANIGALSCTSPYVVFLNSDTVVPQDWLSRLVSPLARDNTIASVTPMSNSATLCSYPDVCKVNDLPHGHNLDTIDAAFCRLSGATLVEIPTAVGYCMAMRRETLARVGFFDGNIFAGMYGEENDWSMRARATGKRHVAGTNLFIYHRDGASLERRPAERSAQRERSLARLELLYPRYSSEISRFVSLDPLSPLRTLVSIALDADSDLRPALLFVHNFELKGGSEQYVERRMANERNRRVLVLDARFSTLTLETRSRSTPAHRVELGEISPRDLRALIHELRVDQIFVNQLVATDIDRMYQLIEESGVPYTVYLHDYYLACPTIRFINSEGSYCGAQTSESVCSSCLVKRFGKSQAELSISAWRHGAHEFLLHAASIIAPSPECRALVNRYYPDVTIKVEPPPLVPARTPSYSVAWAKEPVLTIAIVGAIGKEKGSDLIYDAAAIIHREGLPLRFAVIGFTDRNFAAASLYAGALTVTGEYEADELPTLLARHRPAFAWLPSVWPETYLYTADEVMACGYPLLCFDMGAAAGRVHARNQGWTIPLVSAEQLVEFFMRLERDREEIVSKAGIIFPATEPRAAIEALIAP